MKYDTLPNTEIKVSKIIGATKMNQLKGNIDLSEEIIKEVNAVHAVIPNPAA